MLGRLRKLIEPLRRGNRGRDQGQDRNGDQGRRGRAARPDRRRPNLFDAAAAYVAAGIEDDEHGLAEAAGWVSPEALSFGVNELACRAVIAVARERDESPKTVARSLLGLPAV
ncbi:hypothetical protein [Streptomyces sp. 7N604]|uniref:hypothetical protein n=1 Tax=Streptomyces sp. 7N604 TaxID=3457415 RepID=UPI003FD51DD6